PMVCITIPMPHSHSLPPFLPVSFNHLFSNCSSAHPDLHSFPTRRSSDLTRAAARRELFDYLEPFYNGRRRHSALGYLSPRAFEQDRKSTRLNSSHGSISYAVFCLKKKNQTNIRCHTH